MNEIIVFCVYRNTTGNRKTTVTGLSNKSVQVRLKRTASISFQFKNVETNVFMFAIYKRIEKSRASEMVFRLKNI